MIAKSETFGSWFGAAVFAAVIAGTLNNGNADAQVTAVASDAIVAVEGRVVGVYVADADSIVQLLVQKSELPNLANAAKASYPAPGEYVYIHASADNARRGAFSRRVANQLPNAQAEIRANLILDQLGQWAADGDNWFQPIANINVAATAGTKPNGGAAALGVTTQRVKLGQETGLKVVSVLPGSPAEAAGVEPGDVLVAANRTPLENESQLGDLYAQADRGFSLTVRDVRSGRDVDVDVEMMRGGLGADVPDSRRSGLMKPLGVSTKLAFLSGSPVLEITAVDAGSPAQRAGLAAGWLIVEANGKAVGSPEELTAQEQASRGRLELKVVDPSDRRERIVRVDL